MRLRLREFRYIEHEISDKGIKPEPCKIELIKNLPPPSNVSQLKRLLAMIYYVSKFISSSSKIIRATEVIGKKTFSMTLEGQTPTVL